jgi:hypothetical protein
MSRPLSITQRSPRARHPLRYADLLALVAATPVVLLSGASAVGFVAGVGTWLMIRGLGAMLDHARKVSDGMSRQLGLWLGYRLVRIVLLAGPTIAVREAAGQSAGLTTVAVVASALTIQLFGSVIDRYASAQHSAGVSP